MHMWNAYKVVGVIGGAVVLFLGTVWFLNLGCTTISTFSPQRGSHGYRLWSGESLISFSHRGQDICVPEGWQAVGAVSEDAEEGSARFERGTTGVLIKKESFGLRVLEPRGSSYRVSVLYPLSLSRADIDMLFPIVANAFSEVGVLYGDIVAERVPHTVLVTAGVHESEAIYPDPTARVSYMIGSASSERGEGLLIHAVAHLYNRFSGERQYLEKQKPFSVAEFQELEATWAETALSTHRDAAFKRLTYLYRVHSAVVTQNAELVKDAPPFNDVAAFNRIKPTILVQPGAPYLDVQYGHYVLAPLTMVAIDALLAERNTGLSVRTILTDLHTGKRESFIQTLDEVFSEKDMRAINDWVVADAQIPVSLIERAVALYDRKD